MKKFIIFNAQGKVLRSGSGQNSCFELQANDGEFVFEGEVKDMTQKIKFDGFDEKGKPINPRIINKTSEEIEIDNPKTKPKPFKKQKANITNEQLEDILKRLEQLEAKEDKTQS